ncbi:MAG TPA: aminomethyltransferase family protein [Pyrinomonadaceae bacterium]|nr:aminomethyltransferase family protein [Pyrinomonadaceae bacterium]
MTEALETPTLKKSPLEETHRRLGAIMIESDGWSVPASFGDPLLEYAAVREGGAGLIDISSRGRILVSGSEAIQFLNGLITNDMKTLAVDSWMPAAFPNVQGRLIASVRVLRLNDESTDQTTPAGLPRRGPRQNGCPAFLIDTEAATHERVLKTIERFTLAGDFRVTDMTDQTALISLQGKKAVDQIRAVLGEEASSLSINQAKQVAPATTVWRASPTGEIGFDLMVNAEEAAGLWAALEHAGARPVGQAAFEILRIEAGQPVYGVDMDETNVVTEALDDAVSYTKGCYIGQEIVARIKYRGHVAKKLSGILFKTTTKVAAGAVIKSDGKEIGRVTSAAYSYHLGRTIALAYLKYDYLTPEILVTVLCGSEEVFGKVATLPFVKRSSH